MRKFLTALQIACLALAPHIVHARAPFTTNDVFTIQPFEGRGNITIGVIDGCRGDLSSSSGASGQNQGQTVFSGLVSKKKTIGPLQFTAKESDCIGVLVSPDEAGRYYIGPIKVTSNNTEITVLNTAVSGGLEELISRDEEKLRDKIKEIKNELDPEICSHPEWFDSLPEGCKKIQEALKDIEPPIAVKLPLYKISRGVTIDTEGDAVFMAADADGGYRISLLLNKTKQIAIPRNESLHSVWTLKALEEQNVAVDGKTTKLSKGGVITGRFQGVVQEIEAEQSEHSMTFRFAKDDLLTLWAKITDGHLISWGENGWNTSSKSPAVPFNVKAGSVTLTKPFDSGLQRLLTAGDYLIMFLSSGLTYKADYSVTDSYDSNSFEQIQIDKPYEVTREEDADKNYINLIAHYFPHLNKASMIGDKCYLVPVGTTAPGLSIYRAGETTAVAYFVLAAFCEEEASVPETNRVVVSLKTNYGDAVLDLVRDQIDDLVVFWNKRVWNVGDSFEYAVLIGAEGDEAEVLSGEYTINPVSGVGGPSQNYEPAGFKRQWRIDTGEGVLSLDFSYTVESRNDYSGSFRGYLFLDYDGNGKYEDIRQMASEVKDGKTVFMISVPIVQEDKEKKISFAVAFYDDMGEMIPSFPNGRTKFTFNVPKAGCRAVAPMIYAYRDESGKSVNIGLSVVYGPSLELNDIKIYFGVSKYGRGALYLAGVGKDAPASGTKIPIDVSAFSYRPGELYAQVKIQGIDLNDFWGFRFVGDYLAFLEVETGPSFGGSSGGETKIQAFAPFHIR